MPNLASKTARPYGLSNKDNGRWTQHGGHRAISLLLPGTLMDTLAFADGTATHRSPLVVRVGRRFARPHKPSPLSVSFQVPHPPLSARSCTCPNWSIKMNVRKLIELLEDMPLYHEVVIHSEGDNQFGDVNRVEERDGIVVVIGD